MGREGDTQPQAAIHEVGGGVGRHSVGRGALFHVEQSGPAGPLQGYLKE